MVKSSTWGKIYNIVWTSSMIFSWKFFTMQKMIYSWRLRPIIDLILFSRPLRPLVNSAQLRCCVPYKYVRVRVRASSPSMPSFSMICQGFMPDRTKVKASSSCRYQEESQSLNFLKLSPEKELLMKVRKSSSRSGRLMLASNFQCVIWRLMSSRWMCMPATATRSRRSMKSEWMQPVRWLVCSQMARRGELSLLSASLSMLVTFCRYLPLTSKPLRMSLKLMRLGSVSRHSFTNTTRFRLMASLQPWKQPQPQHLSETSLISFASTSRVFSQCDSPRKCDSAKYSVERSSKFACSSTWIMALINAKRQTIYLLAYKPYAI